MPFISIHFSTGVCAAQVTAPTVNDDRTPLSMRKIKKSNKNLRKNKMKSIQKNTLTMFAIFMMTSSLIYALYKRRNNMKSIQRTAFMMFMIFVLASSFAYATPSTIIWIPSVDFQGYKSFHLGIDNYAYDFKSGKAGSGTAFPTDLGLTVGVLPDSIVLAEIGFDYMTPQWSPFLLNAKVGVPEGAFADWTPAVAVGGFGFGFAKNVTDYNIFYGMVGRHFRF